MTRFDGIQARHAAADSELAWTVGPGDEFLEHAVDDVGWLLDRVTQLQTVANKAAAYRMIETGELHNALGISGPLPQEIDKIRRELDEALAALDTEQL